MSALAARLRLFMAECPMLASRHLAEIASVIAGARPCARVVVPASARTSMERALADLNLFVGSPRVHNIIVRRNGDDRFCERRPGEPEPSNHDATVALVVSRSARNASEGQQVDDQGDSFACGSMLGYPSCCSRAYAEIESGVDWLERLSRKTPAGIHRFNWTANSIAGLFSTDTMHPDFFPCKLGCLAASEFVNTIACAAREIGLEKEWDLGVQLMSRPIVLLDGAAVLLRSPFENSPPVASVVREHRHPNWKTLLSHSQVRFKASPQGVAIFLDDQELLRVRGAKIDFSLTEAP